MRTVAGTTPTLQEKFLQLSFNYCSENYCIFPFISSSFQYSKSSYIFLKKKSLTQKVKNEKKKKEIDNSSQFFKKLLDR